MESEIKLEKINNLQIKPVDSGFNHKKIKHAAMFNSEHFCVFIPSKWGSGKTTNIYNIIEECATTQTDIRIFCTTCDNDKTWV